MRKVPRGWKERAGLAPFNGARTSRRANHPVERGAIWERVTKGFGEARAIDVLGARAHEDDGGSARGECVLERSDDGVIGETVGYDEEPRSGNIVGGAQGGQRLPNDAIAP